MSFLIQNWYAALFIVGCLYFVKLSDNFATAYAIVSGIILYSFYHDASQRLKLIDKSKNDGFTYYQRNSGLEIPRMIVFMGSILGVAGIVHFVYHTFIR